MHERTRGGPFVAVNCGAIPATLIEAECSATKRRIHWSDALPPGGFFERADRELLSSTDHGNGAGDAGPRRCAVRLDSGRFCRVGGDCEIQSKGGDRSTNRNPVTRSRKTICART